MNPAGPSPQDQVITPSGSVQRRFVEMLHDLDAVTWEMDARTWRFTFVSPHAERVFGYPVAEWYDDPDFWRNRLLDPQDRDWCVGFCSTATRECRDHAFLYRARCADGSTRWIKDLVRVVPDESGSAHVMRGIMLDVSSEMDGVRSMHGHAAELDYNAPENETWIRALSAA